MPFTSSSTNKNNKFRLQAEKEKILLCIGEYAVYTITQKVPLLIPVYDKRQIYPLQQVSCAWPNRIECVDLETILASCFKTSTNSLVFSVPEKPQKIISCEITNIFLEKKHLPLPQKNSALAIVNFHYRLALTYLDYCDCTHTVNLNSGLRRQRVTLNTALGHLDVQLQLKCLTPQIIFWQQKNLTEMNCLHKKSNFKPVRFTLRAST